MGGPETGPEATRTIEPEHSAVLGRPSSRKCQASESTLTTIPVRYSRDRVIIPMQLQPSKHRWYVGNPISYMARALSQADRVHHRHAQAGARARCGRGIPQIPEDVVKN